MDKIFIDLEMNKVKQRQTPDGVQFTQETIELGAVRLAGDYQEIARFQSFIRPEFNDHTDQWITENTDITDEDIMNAEPFESVIRSFLDWCGSEYEIYSWSTNDREQLEREMAAKNVKTSIRTLYMFAKWRDLQAEFGNMMSFTRQTALQTAVYNADVQFEGKQHRALTDAVATANIYKEMKRGSIAKVSGQLEEAGKPIGTPIAGMIDFQMLNIA